jgi:hypothetical protein
MIEEVKSLKNRDYGITTSCVVTCCVVTLLAPTLEVVTIMRSDPDPLAQSTSAFEPSGLLWAMFTLTSVTSDVYRLEFPFTQAEKQFGAAGRASAGFVTTTLVMLLPACVALSRKAAACDGTQDGPPDVFGKPKLDAVMHVASGVMLAPDWAFEVVGRDRRSVATSTASEAKYRFFIVILTFNGPPNRNLSGDLS